MKRISTRNIDGTIPLIDGLTLREWEEARTAERRREINAVRARGLRLAAQQMRAAAAGLEADDRDYIDDRARELELVADDIDPR